MSDSFFSASWYRVADLRPRLRKHLKLHRHVYRGQRSYLLENPATGRSHRLSPAAYLLVGLLDGECTVQEAWKLAVERLGDDAPSQDEAIRILGLLHLSESLLCDVAPDTEAMFRRSRRRESEAWWRRWSQPLSLRVPLFDPDPLLDRISPWIQPLFSPAGLAIPALGITFGALIALTHLDELLGDATSSLFATAHLPLLFALYVAVKAIHELGHGIAAKRYGCEIRELGLAFLVFVPMPYVDATSTATLADKRQRIAVSAAGIAVELAVAGFAAILWWLTEPGLLRAVARDLVFVCGISTLVFNGNPLMRFDAYYVLADALEIPNLASRARQYVGYWIQTRVFSMEQVRNPLEADSEAPWLAAYGVAAFVYRILVLVGIAWVLADRFFGLGRVLAIGVVVGQLVVPAIQPLARLFSQPRFEPYRPRILATLGGTALGLFVLTAVVPLPSHSVVEGVIWPPEGTQVRARESGFVVEALARADARVERGDPILRIHDPLAATEARVLSARVRELRAVLQGHQVDDLVRSQIAEKQLAVAQQERDRARERQDAMIVQSPASGRLVLIDVPDLLGRFVEQGDLLGYVVDQSGATARVVVHEETVERVRRDTRSVEVRRASRSGEVETAHLLRELPAAQARLPHAALSTKGGGSWLVRADDPDAVDSPEPVFQFDLALGGDLDGRIGERVLVRFVHTPETLAHRWIRDARNLFLEHLGV